MALRRRMSSVRGDSGRRVEEAVSSTLKKIRLRTKVWFLTTVRCRRGVKYRTQIRIGESTKSRIRIPCSGHESVSNKN
jgi:hypothetical protein